MKKAGAEIWTHANDELRDSPPYHYTGCGLEDVYLANGYEIHETPYGGGIRIRNLEELHDEIGRFLVGHKKTLTGREVRFLRHQIDLTQAELAQLMGCDAQTIARYEKEESKLRGPADRMLRILFEDHLKNRGSAREILETFLSTDDQGNRRLIFEDKDGHWEPSLAA